MLPDTTFSRKTISVRSMAAGFSKTPMMTSRPRVRVRRPASSTVAGWPAHSITTSKPWPSVRFRARAFRRSSRLRIDHRVGAAEPRGFDAPFGHLDGDHLLRAAEARGHQRHQADRPGAHNRDIVLAAGLPLCHGAHGGRERLYQRADLVGDGVGSGGSTDRRSGSDRSASAPPVQEVPRNAT